MKKLFSSVLILALLLALLSTAASAASNPDFSKMSDKELQELYDAVSEDPPIDLSRTF